jgi:hypothetical protein
MDGNAQDGDSDRGSDGDRGDGLSSALANSWIETAFAGAMIHSRSTRYCKIYAFDPWSVVASIPRFAILNFIAASPLVVSKLQHLKLRISSSCLACYLLRMSGSL